MDRGRQVLRQWKLLRLLEQARNGMTVPELSEASGAAATTRTVYRDLEQLQQVGFPLENKNGRWRVYAAAREAWTVPVDPSHVLALQLVGRFLDPVRGTWVAEPLQELEERLRVLLTPVGRAYCEELQQQMAATLFKPVSLPEAIAEQAAHIEEALNEEQRLRMRYASLKGEVEERTVDPYATWFADGRLYLVAHCHRAQAFRTFAVQRIEHVEVLDEPFDRDPTFDLERFTHAGFGVFHDQPQDIVLEFAPDVAYVPRERLLHPSQKVTDLESGAVRLEMTVGGLPEMAAWVAGFGGKVKALAPQRLVDEVVRRYREGLAAQVGE